MIEWLQTYSGIKSTFNTNTEKQELINLRKEYKKYQKKYSNLEKEMKVDSDSDHSDQDEDRDNVDDSVHINQKRSQSKVRTAVSAEVYGEFNKKGDFVPKIIAKNDSQKKRLTDVVSKSFVFNSIDEKELSTVLDAIEEKRFAQGEKVIVEGEKGDLLFIVESGELSCSKVIKGSKTFLKEYKEGEYFGELALLYNAPRAATIEAKTDSILWALDRETFNHIVKDAAIRKREQYEAFLKSMDILKEINSYELSQICDALKTVVKGAKEVIIKEKEEGDNFYILVEGEAYAEKALSYGATPENVKDYKSGDYFGELALIKNEPRAASVIAKTKCKLISLDRRSFKRLLGPIENILKRTSNSYLKYIGN